MFDLCEALTPAVQRNSIDEGYLEDVYKRQALRIYPGYSGAHANLGQALARLGRAREAEAEIEAARRTANH